MEKSAVSLTTGDGDVSGVSVVCGAGGVGVPLQAHIDIVIAVHITAAKSFFNLFIFSPFR